MMRAPAEGQEGEADVVRIPSSRQPGPLHGWLALNWKSEVLQWPWTFTSAANCKWMLADPNFPQFCVSHKQWTSCPSGQQSSCGRNKGGGSELGGALFHPGCVGSPIGVSISTTRDRASLLDG